MRFPVKRKLEDGDHLFDGFMHRPFSEDVDGWRNAIPDANDYPSVRMAQDVVDIFAQLQGAYRRIWELEGRLSKYEQV